MVRHAHQVSIAPAQRARRLLENRAAEWKGRDTDPVLVRLDLQTVEEGLPWMRALQDEELRLLEASKIAERQRQAKEDEIKRKSAWEKKARLEAEAKAKEATEQRLKDQEVFNRKLIRVLTGLAAVVIIAIGASIYAEFNRRDARHQEGIAKTKAIEAMKQKTNADHETLVAQKQSRISDAQRLATLSVAERTANPAHPIRSLLLAVEAVRATADHEEPILAVAEQALHEASASAGGRFLGRWGSDLRPHAFGPNSRMAVYGARGDEVWVYDLADPAPSRSFSVTGMAWREV